MSNTKKNFNPWRCALINIGLGFLILLSPLFILKSFSFALFYLLIISSLSSVNILSVNKKTVLAIFQTPFTTADDPKSDRLGKKLERKVLLLSFASILAKLIFETCMKSFDITLFKIK